MSIAQGAVVLRTLARYLRSGVPLRDAAHVLRETGGRAHGRLAAALIAALDTGRPLGSALTEGGVALGLAGEAQLLTAERVGCLPDVLDALAEEAEAVLALRRRLLGAIAYPATLWLLGIFVLNVPTAVFGGTAAYLRDVGRELGLSMALALGLFVGLPWTLRRLRLFYPVLRLLARVPLLGAAVRRRAELARCDALALAFRAGVPVPESLRHAAASTGWPDDAAVADRVTERVASGRTLEQALRGEPWFGPQALLLVTAGERDGNLERVFSELRRDAREAFLHALDWTRRGVMALLVLSLLGLTAVRLVRGFQSVLPGEGGLLPAGLESLPGLDGAGSNPELKDNLRELEKALR